MAISNTGKLKIPKKTTEVYRAEAEGKPVDHDKDVAKDPGSTTPAKQAKVTPDAAKTTKTPPQKAEKQKAVATKPPVADKGFVLYNIKLPVPAPGEFAKFDDICEILPPKKAVLNSLQRGSELLNEALLEGQKLDLAETYETTGEVAETAKRIPIPVHERMLENFDQHGVLKFAELGRIYAAIALLMFLE